MQRLEVGFIMSKTLSDDYHGRVAPFAVPFAVDTSHLNPYRFGGRKTVDDDGRSSAGRSRFPFGIEQTHLRCSEVHTLPQMLPHSPLLSRLAGTIRKV